MSSARIQRWALILGAHSYQICYRPGKEHLDPDCLSRLPLSEYPKETPVSGDVFFTLHELSKAPITA